MANPPIGNEFWQGPLKIVQATFDGVDLGYTTEDTELEFVETVKDIFYAQFGTEAADKIPTGSAWKVRIKFAQPSATLISILYRGTTISATGKAVKLSRDLYRSGYDNFSKLLSLAAVDSEGTPSTDPNFILNMYKAMFVPTAAILYGPDSQRMIEGEFYCFYDRTNLAYGYSGHASSLGL